jgi:hypothetical protein
VAIGCVPLAGSPGAAQCTPEWAPPPPPLTGSLVRALRTWDPDGPGPAPAILAVGGTIASGVKFWDGASWSVPGGGLSNSPAVLALNEYRGDLLVSGGFSFPGGLSDNQVVRWNGSSWMRLGQTIIAPALGYDPAGDLIAGTAPTGPAYRWTGTDWVILHYRTSQYGLAVISYGGDLIVGGAIEDPTPTGFGVARWTGSDWQGLGPGGPTATSQLFSLAIYQGDLIACGTGSPAMRWNGSSWSSLNYPAAQAYALVTYHGDLIAADTAVRRYTGAGWQTLGEVSGGIVFSLGEYQDEIFVGGSFTSAGGVPAGHIARLRCTPCYANCDGSPAPSPLNVNDFICFQSRFAAQDPYADCDHSGVLNVNDFVCFQSSFAAGCP